jgi:excisionase family DNA binding protein
MESEFLNTYQVEKIYGLKRPTVRLWLKQGRLKGVKAGKIVLISAEDLKQKSERALKGEDFFDK